MFSCSLPSHSRITHFAQALCSLVTSELWTTCSTAPLFKKTVAIEEEITNPVTNTTLRGLAKACYKAH